MKTKVIHQIWLTEREIPLQFQAYSRHLKELHPDYEHVLWRDEDVKKIKFRNAELMAELEGRFNNLGWLVDLYRYEIVLKFGGWYLDMDYQPLKRFGNLLEEVVSGFVVRPDRTRLVRSHTNSMFGVEPGHPFLDHVLEESNRRFIASRSQRVVYLTGSNLISTVAPFYADLNVFGAPEVWDRIHHGPSLPVNPERVYMVHHANSTWANHAPLTQRDSVEVKYG